MKRVWDSVRAERPSIYERRQEPLVERFLGGNLHIMRLDDFHGLLIFLTTTNPEPIRNVEGLNKLISSALRGSFKTTNSMGPKIIFKDQIHGSNTLVEFQTAMGIAVILREIFRNAGLNISPATSAALDFMEHTIPHYPNSTVALNVYISCFAAEIASRLVSIGNEGATESSVMAFTRQYFTAPAETIEFVPEANTQGITASQHQLLHGMAEEGCILFPQNQFLYPVRNLRLVGVVGDSEGSSFLQLSDWEYATHGYSSPLFVPYGNLLAQSLDFSTLVSSPKNSMALILMLPWEADHIEKANELQRRGIPTCLPLGRLFIGEVELGVFKWLRGQTLKDLDDPKIWAQYGQVLRNCHQNGVALEDAAGRNAVLVDGMVHVIDFEHTWFYPQPKPLSDDDRTSSLEKVKLDLQERAKGNALMASFLSGYNGYL